MQTLFSTPLEPFSEENNNLAKYVQFISILEGYKTKVKNLHWAAPNMSTHLSLDDFLEIVSDYQDSIAEETQGIYGQFKPNDIIGTPLPDVEGITMLQGLLPKVQAFYDNLPQDSLHSGLRSETETFIHNINKYKYLFRLCLR